MNRLPFFCLILILLLCGLSSKPQASSPIYIKFILNGRIKSIKNNSKIVFIQNSDTLESTIYHNEVKIPGHLDTLRKVDIYFNFGTNILFFPSVSTKRLLCGQKINWEVGCYNKFSDTIRNEFYNVKDFTKLQKLYYWKILPLEGGDGTIIVVTEPIE